MAVDEPASEIALELDPEFEWRLEQLGRHFSHFTAFRLAMECHTPEKSWHKAVRLKNLGMTEPQIIDQLID
jgi:hypothetical protein